MIPRPMSFRLHSRFSRSGTRLPTKTNTQSPRTLIKSDKPPCARERIGRGGACAGVRGNICGSSSSPQSPLPLPPNPPRTPRGGMCARRSLAGARRQAPKGLPSWRHSLTASHLPMGRAVGGRGGTSPPPPPHCLSATAPRVRYARPPPLQHHPPRRL